MSFNKPLANWDIVLDPKQKRKLLNYHIGGGVLFIKDTEGFRTINIHLGKDGKFYTGTLLLEAYLKSLQEELNEKMALPNQTNP